MNYKLTPSYYARLKSVLKLIGKGNRFLNVGSGSGDYNYYLKDNFLENVGLEYNEQDVALAKSLKGRAKIRYIHGDAHKMRFKHDYFDKAVCIDVLEHVNSHKKVIKEIYRVMKKNGKLIVTVPNRNFPFLYDPINYIRLAMSKKPLKIGAYGYGHLRLFTKKEISDELKRAGFKIKSVSLLSMTLVGLLENYTVWLLGRFLKSNYDNKNVKKEVNREKLLNYNYRIPGILKLFLESVLFVDKLLFSWSKKSMNILVIAEK